MATPQPSHPIRFDLSTPEGREAFYRHRDNDPATFWGLRQALKKIAFEKAETQTQNPA